MGVVWAAVSTFWMEAGVTSIPPVIDTGENPATEPGDIAVASVYGDDPDGFTPPTADWVRISGVDVSGALYSELWVLHITDAMGNAGDMNGETLTWSQSVTGSLGCNVMVLHATAANPCRVLTYAVRTETSASTAHAAPQITTTEASIPLIFGAHRLGSTLSVPAGWVGINPGDDGDHIGGVASVKSEGLAATVDYTPGDFTGGSTAEAVTATVAVVDSLEADPVDPNPIELPTLAFQANVTPLTVDTEDTPSDGTVELPTLAFKATLSVLSPRSSSSTDIRIDVVNVANEPQGKLTIIAVLKGGDNTWVGDTLITPPQRRWEVTDDGIATITLIPTPDIEAIGMTPGTTWYDIHIGKRVIPIVVPVSAAPVELYDCHQLYRDRPTSA